MKRIYISPEITVQVFSDTVQTTEGEPSPTSAVVQAKQYFDDWNYKEIREVLIMRK